MSNTRSRIILVDDNLTNLDIGRKLLSEFYQVIPVPSAEKMFDVLNSITPELILLDVEMPEMNGYEAIKKLKTDPRFESIPVIFLTVKSDDVDESKGLNLGAVDYAYKPFSPQLLHKRIETHLAVKEKNKT